MWSHVTTVCACVYCWRQHKIVWCSSFWQTTKHNAKPFVCKRKMETKEQHFFVFFCSLFHYVFAQWNKKLSEVVSKRKWVRDTLQWQMGFEYNKQLEVFYYRWLCFWGGLFAINDDAVLVWPFESLATFYTHFTYDIHLNGYIQYSFPTILKIIIFSPFDLKFNINPIYDFSFQLCWRQKDVWIVFLNPLTKEPTHKVDVVIKMP